MALALAWALSSCQPASDEKNIDGFWHVEESYSTGRYQADWTIIQNGPRLTLTSVRPGGDSQTGHGSISGSQVSFFLACFSSGCGACSYHFTGTVAEYPAADQSKLPADMSGDVVYCPEDQSLTLTGSWTAKKAQSAPYQ